MSRILVIADIHNDDRALRKVLEKANIYDEIWCLGDVNGHKEYTEEYKHYKGDVVACYRLLMENENKIFCLIGNWEDWLLHPERDNDTQENQNEWGADLKQYRIVLGQADANLLEWISGWPIQKKKDLFTLVHGCVQPSNNPRDTRERITERALAPREVDNEASVIHPLAWEYDKTIRNKIDHHIWALLADISFNYVGPITQDLDSLLAIQMLDQISIEKAWRKITHHLEETARALDENRVPDWGFTSSVVKKYFERFYSQADPASDGWQDEVVEKLLFSWTSSSSITIPPIKMDTEAAERLRLAHILKPGGIRELLLVSIFNAIYRTGVYREKEEKAKSQQLLNGLFKKLSPGSFYQKEILQFLISRAQQEAEKRNFIDAATLNTVIWNKIEGEFANWIACDIFESQKSIEEMERSAQILDKTHPVSIRLLKDLEKIKAILSKTSEVEKSYLDDNLNLAEMRLSELKDLPSDLAAKYIDIEDWENRINLCNELKKASSSWDAENLSHLLDSVKTSKFPPVYERLKLNLIERVSTLHKMDEVENDLKVFNPAHPEELIPIWEKITAIEEAGNGENPPQLEGLREVWKGKINIYLDEIRTRISGFSSDEQKKESKKSGDLREIGKGIQEELKRLKKICEDCSQYPLADDCQVMEKDLESKFKELEDQVRIKQKKYQDEYLELLNKAGNNVEGLTTAKNFLVRDLADSYILDKGFNEWRDEEIYYIDKLIRAVTTLSTAKDVQSAIDDIRSYLDVIKRYPDGFKIKDDLQRVVLDNELRQKTFQELVEQRTFLSSLENHVEQKFTQQNSASASLENHLKKLYWFDALLAFFMFGLLALSFFTLRKISISGLAQVIQKSTAIVVPATNTPMSNPAPQSEITLTPVATDTPSPSPIPVQITKLANDIKLGDLDSTGQMFPFWTYKPSNDVNFSVQKLETKDDYTRITCVILFEAIKIQDGKAPSLTNVYAYQLTTGEAPVAIGFVNNPFTLPTNPPGKIININNVEYIQVTYIGWVLTSNLVDVTK